MCILDQYSWASPNSPSLGSLPPYLALFSRVTLPFLSWFPRVTLPFLPRACLWVFTFSPLEAGQPLYLPPAMGKAMSPSVLQGTFQGLAWLCRTPFVSCFPGVTRSGMFFFPCFLLETLCWAHWDSGWVKSVLGWCLMDCWQGYLCHRPHTTSTHQALPNCYN